jgi:hypothetical protein
MAKKKATVKKIDMGTEEAIELLLHLEALEPNEQWEAIEYILEYTSNFEYLVNSFDRYVLKRRVKEKKKNGQSEKF